MSETKTKLIKITILLGILLASLLHIPMRVVTGKEERYHYEQKLG